MDNVQTDKPVEKSTSNSDEICYKKYFNIGIAILLLIFLIYIFAMGGGMGGVFWAAFLSTFLLFPVVFIGNTLLGDCPK
jgi:fatty-acid desaturase